MTGRVDILGAFSRKIVKKLKMKSQERKNVALAYLYENSFKIYFFGSCDFNYNFFCSFRKNAPDIPEDLSFMNFFSSNI